MENNAFLPGLHERALSATLARQLTCRPAISAWAAGKSAIFTAAGKKLTRSYEGVLTGKNILFGGSSPVPRATGYGVVYFAQAMLLADRKRKPGRQDLRCFRRGQCRNLLLPEIARPVIGALPVTVTDSAA